MKKEIFGWCIITALLGAVWFFGWSQVAAWAWPWAGISRAGLALIGVAYLGGSIIALIDVWADCCLEAERRRRMNPDT